jgi:hypothetical protein
VDDGQLYIHFVERQPNIHQHQRKFSGVCYTDMLTG